jgi:hypothetical protein
MQGWKIRKAYITQGVVLGLLKQAYDCTSTSESTTILQIGKEQPYEDGTVFIVRDIRGFCQVLMQAYMLLNTQNSKIIEDANEVDIFLSKNIHYLAGGGTLRGGVIPATQNLPWRALKSSLQECGVGPLSLALKNTHGGTCKRLDWYAQVRLDMHADAALAFRC